LDFIERRQGKRTYWDFTEVSELIRAILIQLAKTITQKLDISTQLWLLDYWQHQLWKAQRNTLIAEILESAKKSLHLAQPQLVFDVCLMKLAEFEAFLRVCA
jgi:hypothetical protein